MTCHLELFTVFGSGFIYLLFQDYLTVIDTPMDFGTMRERLKLSRYRTPHEFTRDARLVFHNSKTYNTNARSRVSGRGTNREIDR